MYYNGTNWVTANHGEHATEYPPSEFAGSGSVSVYQRIISSPVVWQFRFPVPRLAVPIEVRITKTSYSTHDDCPNGTVMSPGSWPSRTSLASSSIQMALAQINAQPAATSPASRTSPASTTSHCQGAIDYDTTNKAFAGTWNGIWRMDWTDNPAFIVKDLVENKTYGWARSITSRSMTGMCMTQANGEKDVLRMAIHASPLTASLQSHGSARKQSITSAVSFLDGL